MDLRHQLRGCFLGSLVVAAALGCSNSSPPAQALAPDGRGPTPEWFSDVTERVGIRYDPAARPSDPYFMPLIMLGAAGVFDADNDGRLDVFLAPGGEKGAGSPSKFYRQKPDGTFEDATAAAGLEIYGWGQGVAAGDVNNDGWVDLVVTGYGRVWLFRNNGNGTFTEVSVDAGVDNPQWGTSAAFVDYDRDGWLDLVVANYVAYIPTKPCTDTGGQRNFCGPRAFEGTPSRLFRNLGEAGLTRTAKVGFVDVTVAAGLAARPGPGLGVICADFDGDRWPDIFVANDGKPNHLWVNQKNGTFKEEGLFRGVANNAMGQAEANMGIALGDIDRNGLFDLFVTHLTTETHRLWVQTRRGQFRDRTNDVGLAETANRSTGFGTLLADFDNDGDEDLVLANGMVTRPADVPEAASPGNFWVPYRERNQLQANDGTGKFTNVSDANPAVCGTPGVYRVVVVADLDNDGAPDLLVTRLDGPARVYRNVAPDRGHWVTVRAVDPALKRDAYGAELTVRAGGRSHSRWMNPGYSYACSNDPRAHVGLGAAASVDEFRVVWPDGKEEAFDGCPADRAVTLRKGEGKPVGPATR